MFDFGRLQLAKIMRERQPKIEAAESKPHASRAADLRIDMVEVPYLVARLIDSSMYNYYSFCTSKIA